jgi:hypothetical protein
MNHSVNYPSGSMFRKESLKIPKGNWKPYIGGQTKQWPNEKGQKYKQ